MRKSCEVLDTHFCHPEDAGLSACPVSSVYLYMVLAFAAYKSEGAKLTIILGFMV